MTLKNSLFRQCGSSSCRHDFQQVRQHRVTSLKGSIQCVQYSTQYIVRTISGKFTSQSGQMFYPGYIHLTPQRHPSDVYRIQNQKNNWTFQQINLIWFSFLSLKLFKKSVVYADTGSATHGYKTGFESKASLLFEQ